ncbi:hypothetical protein L1887_45794 [Cichorium endivia]|nr:hypothetical protein L1887_45794 [Cichorium endivia]
MYKNILMPVDVFEMDLSDKAVRHAANLAKAEGASITLVNILPASSRSLLRGFNADIKKFEEHGCVLATSGMRNYQAEQGGGNMMRLSSGRKTRASPRICWDSNAESILRYATIPVLVVR